MIEKQPSCDDPVESDLLPVDVARQRLFSALKPCTQSESLGISQSFRRVLARNISSPFSVPGHTNSAMDGYAINSKSIPVDGERRLDLRGSSWAGRPFQEMIGEGEAVRVFTGAVMPMGTDTVVIQEHAQVADNAVVIDSDVVAGKNVRMAGEDVEKGQTVFSAGRQLQASDIGVLASLGIRKVEVTKRLKVAFFTTGDELVSLEDHQPGALLPEGMLFDSNRHTLKALLDQANVDAIDLGVVRDNESDTRSALVHASESADVIVSSGGVSAGEADYVTRAFHDLGDVSFWKLAMRPGRPLAFGYVGNAAFFGLPGNPVAVMVTFLEFVQPAIRYLCGMDQLETVPLPALSESELRKSKGRVEYQRGIMRVTADGQLVVRSTGKQGAGRLSSMSQANCLIVIDAERDGVKAGDYVGVQPFHGLLDL